MHRCVRKRLQYFPEDSMTPIGKVHKSSDRHVKWEIQDLSIFSEKADEYHYSPSFTFAGDSWKYMLSVTQELPQKRLVLLVVLQRESSGPPIKIKLDIYLGSKTLVDKQYHENFHYTARVFDKTECSFGAFFHIEACRLPDYVLTTVMKNLESVEDASDEPLCRDFKKVLLDGQNHDLVLKIGDKELRAHQDILSARSRVFGSMLNHDMQEKNSGVINLPDCDPQAMELFLYYVYSGKVETLDQSNMLGLYYIADKYEMEHLKDECSKFIKKSMSSTNICDIIQLAIKHSDSFLLEYATEYFRNNMLDIMRTVEWQSFLKDNSTVGNELLIKSIEKSKALQD